MQSDSGVGAGGCTLREHRGAGRLVRGHCARDRVFALALMLMLALLMPPHVRAQSPGVPPDLDVPSAEYLPQDQLDALLAPIALYPDDLLAQVLMASTYPLEVVEAARFAQQNPGLAGAALDDAVRNMRWDPSVQSLTAFPQVLAMMSDRLEWTQQLGDAVLANRQQVMDTVQALRVRAEAAGTLQDSDQQRVYTSDQAIVIEPAQFDYVYVPVYDPMVAYGPWWVASYQPFFWYPPAFYGYAVRWQGWGIAWGRPCRVDRNHWGWAHPEWRAGTIAVTIGRNEFFNRPQYRNYRGTVAWQHAPDHRRGVAHGSALVRERFGNADRRAIDARRELRSGAPSPPAGRQAIAPRTTTHAPQTAPGYRLAPSEPRAAPQRAPDYRQAPSDPRAARAPEYRQPPSDPRAQRAPEYRQAPPDQRAALAVRQSPGMPQAQAQQRVAPPSSLPQRMIVTTPQAAPAPPPSMPHAIVTTPQAAPAYAPAPAHGRAVRAAPAPPDAGDTGPSRR